MSIGRARLLLMLWAAHALQRPGRLLMSVGVIAIGVALGLGVNLVNHSALAEFQASLARINGEADLSIRARIGTLDDRLYERIARDPAIAAASPVIAFEAEVLDPPRNDGPPPRLEVLGIDPLRAGAITPALVPSADTPIALFDTDAVFLSPAAARMLGVAAGDTVVLKAGIHEQRLVLVGELPGIGGGQQLAVIDIATAQWRFGWSGAIERIDLRLADDTDPAALQVRWRDAIPAATWSTPDLASSRMSNLSRAYRVNLTMLALVALLTGLFLVHANLALATRRQWPEFALLATLGASRRLIATAVLGQGLAAGIGGALLGCALGVALARLALATIGGDLGAGLLRAAEVPIAIDAPMVAVFATLGIAVGIAGSAAPALRAREIAPARALRGLPDTHARGRRADIVALAAFLAGAAALALPPIAELPLGAYAAIGLWLLAVVSRAGSLVAIGTAAIARDRRLGWCLPPLWLGLARLRERPGDSTAALSGVVASVALAVAMATMVHSFRDSVVQWLDVVLPADVYARASVTGSAGGIDPALGDAIAAVDGVASLAWMRVLPIEMDARRPPATLLAREIDGDAPQRSLPLTGRLAEVPENCTAVFGSEAMADLYGWAPGLRVELPIGPPGHCFSVGGIWRDYARQHGAIAIDRTAWRRLSGDDTVSDLSIRLAPGADTGAVIARLRALDPRLAGLQWRDADEIRAVSLAIFDRSFAATYALEAVAILLGILGVAAGYAAEALARQREFGVLQHLGMARRRIAGMLAAEAGSMVAIGCLIGFVLGAAIAFILVFQVNPVSFHWRMDITWPFGLLTAGGLALVGIAAATAATVARHAMRRSPATAVRADW
ncbi:MAG: FtsX-like permease family protein [Burkholderiaceae bacterium]|jgi:putative ABC transport system permease protein|nr:FtsX-like permease family protein [Burkholderiaceae bacterium]